MEIDHNFLEQSLNGTYENIDRTVCVVYADSSFFQVNDTRFERNLTDQIISYSLGGKLQDDTGGNDAEFNPIEPSNLPKRYPDRKPCDDRDHAATGSERERVRELCIENSYPFQFNFSRNSSNDPPEMEVNDYYFQKDECVYWDMASFKWNNEGLLSKFSDYRTSHTCVYGLCWIDFRGMGSSTFHMIFI